jgi:hypothetical protein
MLKALLFVVMLLSSTFLEAQNMPVSSGGNGQSSEGSISYSVGQTMFTPILGDEVDLSPGNQQPAEISFIPSVGASFEMGGFTLFPNPSRDQIMIGTENLNGVVNLEIRNAIGQVLLTDLITENNHQLNVRQLAAGSYFVYLISNQAQFTTLKLIKL